MQSFETHGGKKLNMLIDKKTSNICLQFSPGGALPEELAGLFTSEKDAVKAINIYLARTNKTKE